uniref:Amino acid transporter transmembrane domain-containing protein n=1 Tax=Parascaris univalens TaxID=6257 RepID=A0A914ZJV6_PARUN
MTAIVTYTAYILGKSWVILQRHWPKYRDHCRKPYPEMGERAMGPFIKLIVTVCIDITQFGIAVVYVLLSAKNIHDFIGAFFEADFSFCYVILIVGACLLPVTFLKSPQDFWVAVVIGMVTTSCAVILIVIGSALDYGTCAPEVGENVKFVPIIALLYAPVCIMGYITYGNSIQASIINSLQITGIQQAVNILITAHCVLTLTIAFNPLNQDIEELFNVAHHFCWQRVAVRTGVMVAVVFTAESLPTFGPLLDLVGGSTLTLTSLVFPCFFYLYLSAAEEKTLRKGGDVLEEDPLTFMEVIERTPKLRLATCAFVILFGLIGGAAATYSAVNELATTQFTAPCYIQPFLNTVHPSDRQRHTNCCGNWQNITRTGDSSVCNDYVDFYKQND